MAWTQRARADAGTDLDGVTINVADAIAPTASEYTGTSDTACVVETMNAILALSGITGSMVQQNATANLTTANSSYSVAFGSDNTEGNTLVVALTCSPDAFGPVPFVNGMGACTVTDSNGNTYIQILNQVLLGGLQQLAIFVATGCVAGGPNTVTATSARACPNVDSCSFSEPAMAVLEYPGGTGVDGIALAESATGGSLSVSLTTGAPGDTLLNIVGMGPSCPPPSPVLTGPTGGPVIPGAWLVVNEPPSGSPATGGGFTDRSSFLYLGQGTQHSFNLQNRQRGNATYTLVSDPFDPTSAPADYRPTLFQPIYLFDQNDAGYTLVFAGLIQDYTVRWVGLDGLHYIDCTAVSLEAVFDTIYCDGTDQFVNETCGAILTALFAKYENGAPVSIGTVQAGVTIPLFNPQKGQKISEIFQQLALTSDFIWGVNPSLQQLYFCAPTAQPAPFNLTSDEVLWDTISDKIDGGEYRNRQGVKISDEAFPQSGEWFAGSGQETITLLRPLKQGVSAYITLAGPANSATGTFSGQPSQGDTITIGPQDIGWSVHQGSNPWVVGEVIVVSGFVFQCTVGGDSANTQPPAFLTETTRGDTVTDGVAIWTCLGAYGTGAGELASSTYTFVDSIDGYYGAIGVYPVSALNPSGQLPGNAQYGLVVIGSTLAETVQNLVDAINSAAPYGGPPATNGRGVTFSLPTWEGAQVNASVLSGTQIKVVNKQDAIVAVSQLSTTSMAFSWSSALTKGGSFPQGSLGPNEPGTISIQVYQQGTNTAAPAVSYTPGSDTIGLASPLDAGSYLNFWYTRADGGSVEVEDTALVTALAAISHGTGKIQQFTDQSSQGIISTSAEAALQLAQEALAGFSTPPSTLEVELFQPGILPGQIWTWALTFNSALNGQWFVTEVKGEIIPGVTHGTGIDNPNTPGGGHYKYTIKVVNTAQLADYLDVWEGFAGGSSGGGALGAGALVPTSGAGLSTSGNYGPTIEVNGTDGSGDALGIANLESGPGVTVTDLGGGAYQFSSSGASPVSAAKYTTSWSGQTSVTVTHNLGTTQVLVQVYDGSGNLVIPENVQLTSANVVSLTFGAAFTGSVVVIGIGATPSAQSYTTSWSAQTSVTVTHNLGTENVFVQVTDASGNIVTPEDIDITSGTALTLTFGAAFTGSVLVVALNAQVKQANGSFTNQTSYEFAHGLGTTAVIVQVYDGSGNQVTPQNVAVTDANDVTLTFGASFSGSVVVMG